MKVVKNCKAEHGLHWQAISEKPFDFSGVVMHLDSLTKLVVEEFAGLGKKQYGIHKIDFGKNFSFFVSHVEIEKQKYELATGYPVLFTQQENPMEIHSINEWKIEVEAQITGKIGDASLSFFAIDYFLNKEEYLKGEIKKVKLSAIAYNAHTADKEHKIEVEGKEYDISKAQIIIPLDLTKNKMASIDDYAVQSKIVGFETVEVKGKKAFIIKTELQPLKTLDIFVLEEHLKGKLKKGTILFANVWLQGEKTDNVWNVMGNRKNKNKVKKE